MSQATVRVAMTRQFFEALVVKPECHQHMCGDNTRIIREAVHNRVDDHESDQTRSGLPEEGRD